MISLYKEYIKVYDRLRPEGTHEEKHNIGAVAGEIVKCVTAITSFHGNEGIRKTLDYIANPDEEPFPDFPKICHGLVLFLQHVKEKNMDKINDKMYYRRRGPFNEQDIDIVIRYMDRLEAILRKRIYIESLNKQTIPNSEESEHVAKQQKEKTDSVTSPGEMKRKTVSWASKLEHSAPKKLCH